MRGGPCGGRSPLSGESPLCRCTAGTFSICLLRSGFSCSAVALVPGRWGQIQLCVPFAGHSFFKPSAGGGGTREQAGRRWPAGCPRGSGLAPVAVAPMEGDSPVWPRSPLTTLLGLTFQRRRTPAQCDPHAAFLCAENLAARTGRPRSSRCCSLSRQVTGSPTVWPKGKSCESLQRRSLWGGGGGRFPSPETVSLQL